MKLDYTKLTDIELDGIDTTDYPQFCDAYICNATYDGREITDEELDILNEDGSFIHGQVINHIY